MLTLVIHCPLFVWIQEVADLTYCTLNVDLSNSLFFKTTWCIMLLWNCLFCATNRISTQCKIIVNWKKDQQISILHWYSITLLWHCQTHKYIQQFSQMILSDAENQSYCGSRFRSLQTESAMDDGLFRITATQGTGKHNGTLGTRKDRWLNKELN